MQELYKSGTPDRMITGRWRRFLTVLALVLLAGMLLVGTAGATDVMIWTNDTHEWTGGNITAAWTTGNTMSVTWQDDLNLTEDDQVGVVTLYCPDNMNYLVEVWGGMAYLYSGEWDFSLYDIPNLYTFDGCHFAMVSGDYWEKK
jgi:hypothetical protein